MNILVTGALGFIGYHLCAKLLSSGHTVYGIDLRYSVFTDPDKHTKYLNLARNLNFKLIYHDLSIGKTLAGGWDPFDIVYHLAASTGVQASKDSPEIYFNNNVLAFHNVLMACHDYKIPKLIYSSSSSVYGDQSYEMSEGNSTTDQVSYYAGTKRAGEALAKSMSNHFLETDIVCCRFFTVYGPYGRKDMAPFIFAEKIMNGQEIELRDGLNGEIELSRDFTYIDDIVEGLIDVTSISMYGGNHRIFNIGHGSPILVRDFITLLEQELGKKAIIKHVGLPESDVRQTYASMAKYELDINFNRLKTSPEEGVKKFIAWYKETLK